MVAGIFCGKTGISVNTVIRIEGGQSATSIEVFKKIAEELKTDVNTLLGKTALSHGLSDT